MPFFIDADDTLIVSNVSGICRQFNRIYDSGVLFANDYAGVMFPAPDPTLQWYIHSNYGPYGMINSGGWCGLIDDIIQLLTQIQQTRSEILQEGEVKSQRVQKLFASPSIHLIESTIHSAFKHRLIDDEQWLIHIMQLEYNPLIKVDQYRQMFAFVESLNILPQPIHSRQCTGAAHFLHSSHMCKGKKREGYDPKWLELARSICQ